MKNDFKGLSIEVLAQNLAIENLKMIANSEVSGDIIDLKLAFIKHLISGMVLEVLVAIPTSSSKEEQYKAAYNAYSEIKTAMQNSVADAFTMTFSKYAGQDVDYYCQITPAGKPSSKLPC